VLAATDAGCSDSLTDADVGEMLLRRYLFIHLDNDGDKFELLALMLRKLYAFVDGTVSEDNADSLMNQVRAMTCSGCRIDCCGQPPYELNLMNRTHVSPPPPPPLSSRAHPLSRHRNCYCRAICT
jgi:hypothetical protein